MINFKTFSAAGIVGVFMLGGIASMAATNSIPLDGDTNLVAQANSKSDKGNPTDNKNNNGNSQNDKKDAKNDPKAQKGDLKDLRGNKVEVAKGRSGQVVRKNATPKELAQQFSKQRDAFLAKQNDLLASLRTATEENKASIRAKIKEEREKWFDEQTKLREELKERMKELRQEFKNDEMQRVLDKAKDDKGRRHGLN